MNRFSWSTKIAFWIRSTAIGEITSNYKSLFNAPWQIISVPRNRVSLADAVGTYLFNSQIVTLPDGNMLMVCPVECRKSTPIREFIDSKIVAAENPINEVVYQDVQQSMKNGGGPACLRLRVVLTDEQIATLPPRVFFNDETYAFLRDWIDAKYPEELCPEDLADADRFQHNRRALTELHDFIGID